MAKRKIKNIPIEHKSTPYDYQMLMSHKCWEKMNKILEDVKLIPKRPLTELLELQGVLDSINRELKSNPEAFTPKGMGLRMHEELEKRMEGGRGISIIGTGGDPFSEMAREHIMYKGVVCKPRMVGYGDQLEMYRAARFMQVEPFTPPPPGEVTCSSTTVPGMFDAYMKDQMIVDFKMSPSMYPSSTMTSYSGSVRRVDDPDLWDKYTKTHNKYCRRRDLVDKYDPNAKVHKPLQKPTSYDIHRINESHGLRKYLIGEEYVWALNITNAKRKAKKNENRTK